MNVRIFSGAGDSGVKKVEREINEWLADSDVEVKQMNSSMCQVADDGESGERFQYFAITLLYETK